MKKISFSNALAIWARENTWTILIITSFIIIELAGRFVNQYQRDWSSFTWPAIGIGFLFSVMTISKLGSENKKINKALTGNRRWIFVITLVVISLFFAYHKLTMLAELNPLLIASKFLLFSLIVMSIWYVVITLIYFDPITTITMLICGTFGFFFIMIAHEKASPLQMVAGVLGGISAGYLTALFLKRKINQPREDNEEYRLIDVEQSQELIDDMTSLTRRRKFERALNIISEIKSLLYGHEFEQTLLNNFWSHVHTFQNNLTNDEPVNPEKIEEVLLDLRIARETLEKMKPEVRTVMSKDNTKPPDKIISNKKELIIILCSTVICALIGLIIGLTRYSKCEVLGIIFLIAMFAFCGLGVGIIIINQHKKH